jgi:sarcosine oxidase
MSDCYDFIVLGLGGVGSAAAAHLASSCFHVLGIDQYWPPHSQGSSHGQTRIIRKAYFEHPDYVPLLKRAYELWHHLQANYGQTLYVPTGLLQAGPADGEVLSGVKRSACEHGLPIESMTMAQATARFPGLVGDPSWQAILEVDAGYLRVESCVAAHLQLARQHGAEILLGQPVMNWHAESSQVSVTTQQQTFRAGGLVIAAGAWASQCLNRYRLPLQVLRKHLYWYPAPNKYHQDQGFPCFFYDTPYGYFYGFPNNADPETGANQGLKVARHSGGTELEHPEGDPHPENRQDRDSVENFLDRFLPQVGRPLQRWAGCYYTMTPDQHFVVDCLPDASNVTIVAGLSGHGFKFTSVLGELAAQLVTNQQLSTPIEFLRIR